MSRRFSLAPPLFLFLWALWFVLPFTRDAARTQWKARFAPRPTSYAPTPLPLDDESRDAQFVRALDQSQGKPRTEALELLGRKFPDDPAICAAQIVMSWHDLHMGNNRQLGPSSNADLNWSVKLTKIEMPDAKALALWMAATSRGAKLEPNNTFWDWAQLMGLLSARRDEEVWAVLRAASQKTGYDDHTGEGALARLRVAKKHDVLSPISQLGVSASVLFPHFSKMRETARQLSDDASGLRLSGESQKQTQALEGMRDFMLLSRTMRRESKSFIGSLVGQAMETIALWGGSYSPLRPTRVRRPISPSPLYTSDPRSLAVFARNLKRPDIAAQLNAEWTQLGPWLTKVRAASANSSFLAGIEPRDMWLAQAGGWLGLLLLMSVPSLLFVAIASFLLLRFVPMWRRENTVSPTRASWVWGAILTFVVCLALSSPLLATLWSSLRPGGLNILDLLGALSFDLRDGGVQLVPPSWSAWFPALVGFLAALQMARFWNARREGKPGLGAKLRGVLHAPDDDMTRFDLSPLLSLAGVIAAFFVLTVGVVGFLIAASSTSSTSLQDNAGWVLLGLALVLILPLASGLKSAPSRTFTLVLARRFAWGQLLFVTLLWGLLWTIAAPAQKRFDAQMSRQLQVGEFQITRKSLGI